MTRALVLGPATLLVDGAPADLGGTRTRAVLAALAERAGTPVPAAELISLVWGGDAPRTVANQLQIAVHRIRAALGEEGHRVLRLDGAGYVLEVETDLADFRADVAAGNRAAATGDWTAARDRYRAALALWRGEPGERLAEEHLDALTRRLVTDLIAGDTAVVIADTATSAERHPANDRLWHLRLLALARENVHGAINEYRRLRERRAEETGLDLGGELRAFGDALPGADLDAALDAVRDWITGATRRPVPMELPAAVGDFTGRDEETAHLATALKEPGAVVAIVGLGGAGKTALAVRAARASERPDGCLFTDLRGVDERPREPHAVLGSFLRSLGVPGDSVPTDPAARLGLYRTLTATRSVTVVLDNAYDAAQVRDLLPTGEGCATIVTARTTLPGLDAERVRLDSLPEADAVELLARLARRRDDEDVMREVAALAGRLPLALRIIGARLARRKDLGFARMRARLADDAHRFAELAEGDRMVRSCIEIGYRRLSREATEALRAAAWLPLADFTLDVLAGALGISPARAETIADELVDAQLMNATGGEHPGYTIHDLVRLYVRETNAGRAGERHGVLTTAYTALLAAALAADAALPYFTYLPPEPREPAPAPDDPTAWFTAHVPMLLAAVPDARDIGEGDLARLLTTASVKFLAHRYRWPELRDLLTGFDGLADPWLDWARAMLAHAESRPDDGVTAVRRARLAYRRAGDPLRAAAVCANYSTAAHATGRLRLAEAADRWGLRVWAELRDDRPAALAQRARLATQLGNLVIHTDPEETRRLAEIGIDAARAAGDLITEGLALAARSFAHRFAGRFDDAENDIDVAIERASAVGDHSVRLQLLLLRADVGLVREDLDAAAARYRDLITEAREIGAPLIEARALRSLAVVHGTRGDYREEARLAEAALVPMRVHGPAIYIASTLQTVAVARAALGDYAEARAACEEALAMLPAEHPLATTLRKVLTEHVKG